MYDTKDNFTSYNNSNNNNNNNNLEEKVRTTEEELKRTKKNLDEVVAEIVISENEVHNKLEEIYKYN